MIFLTCTNWYVNTNWYDSVKCFFKLSLYIYIIVLYIYIYIYIYILMVERPLMVRWVVGSIPHGGPIELFLVPASSPTFGVTKVVYALSCLWNGAYKRTLAAIQNE